MLLFCGRKTEKRPRLFCPNPRKQGAFSRAAALRNFFALRYTRETMTYSVVDKSPLCKTMLLKRIKRRLIQSRVNCRDESCLETAVCK
jgi:hypothetical protein